MKEYERVIHRIKEMRQRYIRQSIDFDYESENIYTKEAMTNEFIFGRRYDDETPTPRINKYLPFHLRVEKRLNPETRRADCFLDLKINSAAFKHEFKSERLLDWNKFVRLHRKIILNRMPHDMKKLYFKLENGKPANNSSDTQSDESN